MIAVSFTRPFRAVALLSTLALATLNGCREQTQDRPRLEDYGARNAVCMAWSDGCRTCQRGEAGVAPACSLPGIACVRGPIVCDADATRSN